MSIGFQVDRSVVSRNERLGLTVVARNSSSASVKEMRIEISQEATWYAHGVPATKKRILSSVVVSGSQLRETDKGKGHAHAPDDATDPPRAVGDGDKVGLHEVLAAGAGGRHEVVVPETCSDSLRAGIIEVNHSLEVILDAPNCISSPEVWTSLIIQREMLGGGVAGGGETEAVAMPQAGSDTKPGLSKPPLVPRDKKSADDAGDNPAAKPAPITVPQRSVNIRLDELRTPASSRAAGF